MLAFRKESDGWLACWLEKIDSIKNACNSFVPATLLRPSVNMIAKDGSLANALTVILRRKVLVFCFLFVVEINGEEDCFALSNLIESISKASQG